MNPHLNQLTHVIIGAAIEVHRKLGPVYLSRRIVNVYAENWYCGVWALDAKKACRLSTRELSWIVVTESTSW
jgi:hypothetical protein